MKAASDEPPPRPAWAGNALVEMGVDAGDVEVGGNEVIGLHHEIVRLVAGLKVTADVDVDIPAAGKAVVHLLDFQYISEWSGIENGLNIMETIFAQTHDVQSEVDFATRKRYHSLSLLLTMD